VQLDGDSVGFRLPAKSVVRRTVSLEDPLVVRAVRSLLRIETTSARLLVYRTPAGWSEIHERRRSPEARLETIEHATARMIKRVRQLRTVALLRGSRQI